MGGMEEEEEEEDVGQDPGAAGGSRGPWAELRELRSRMDRLQDDYVNSQRLNRLLEERLRALAQALVLERELLSRRVAAMLQGALGTPPGQTVAAAAEEEAPLPPPPPAFRDPQP